MKHKHFVEEVEDSQRLLNEGHHHLKDKHETLVKKAKEHGRWVRTFTGNQLREDLTNRRGPLGPQSLFKNQYL